MAFDSESRQGEASGNARSGSGQSENYYIL